MSRSPFCHLLTIALLVTAASFQVACAVETEADDDSAEAESEGAELSAAGRALIGTYEGGATLRRLDLSATKVGTANAFTADIVVGEGPLRVQGTFTAGATFITFRTTNPSPDAARFVGRYRYAAAGSELRLSRAGMTETLAKAKPAGPGPLGTCPTGTFTQSFANTITQTVTPVSGNTDRYQAPAFKRLITRFQGRKWTRDAAGQWTSRPAALDGFNGELYLGERRANGAFELVLHAKTNRYVSRDSSRGELRRYVYFEGSFDARLDSAEIAAPVTLAGRLSENPWGSFGSPPDALVLRGPARFTDHCFSMLDAPLAETTTEINEAFATY